MPETTSYAAAKKAVDILLDNGHETYFVGGAVRDQVMGRTPKDWDVVTSANMQNIKQLFPHHVVLPNSDYTTKVIIVVDGADHIVEISSYRPDCATIDEDIKHRDFTMNALLQDPLSNTILDHVGGKRDIELGIIRCVRDPVLCFKEDPLRLLRAVRFVGQLGFRIDKDLQTSIRNNVEFIRSCSQERVRDEFLKIVTSDYLGDALIYLERLGLSERSSYLSSFRLNNVMTLVRAADKTGKISDHVIGLAFLLKLSGRSWNPRTTLCGMGLSNQDVDSIVDILSLDDKLTDRWHTHISSLAGIRRVANDKNIDKALELFMLLFNAGDGSRDTGGTIAKIRQGKQLGLPAKLVTGDDLLEWGFIQGPKLGEMLEEAYTFQLNNLDANKESVQHYICNVKYKSTIRLLPDGKYSDGSKRTRMGARCTNCNALMMFTTGVETSKYASGNIVSTLLKDRILETLNCRNDSYEFVACTQCGKRRMKDKFNAVKED